VSDYALIAARSYVAEQDVYICPAGESLPGRLLINRAWSVRFDRCQPCPDSGGIRSAPK
jgi:hypothetical protein